MPPAHTTDISEQDRQAAERSLKIRRFSDSELTGRTHRVQQELARRGLDALVLTDEVNVKYFTGMATPSFATRSRPLIVIVPATADPILICSRSQSANARAASAIQNIRPFERFEPDAVQELVGCLRDVDLARGRLGFELGPEQRLGLTHIGFMSVIERLPGAEFVDGGPAVWATRLIKSAEEISIMRTAATLNSSAMTEAVARTQPGDTERDIRKRWSTALMDGGADRPGYFAIHSGPTSYRRVSSEATARVLRPGDLVWMDGGPVYDGYWSDITRMAAVGHSRPEDRDRYTFAWTIVQELIGFVGPGKTAGDIARHAAGLFASAGSSMGGASRIGHGIGAELTEPPSIVDGDETELVPGMTLSIETGLADWDGYFLMEDNVVITPTGAELLSSPAPSELPVVS